MVKNVLRVILLILLSPLWLILIFITFITALMVFAMTGKWGFPNLLDVWHDMQNE